MKKVYLVISEFTNDSDSDRNMYVFKNYDNAKFKFEMIRKEIKNLNLGYDEIEDEKDCYCESISGEYLYYHELVYIQEKDVLDYE